MERNALYLVYGAAGVMGIASFAAPHVMRTYATPYAAEAQGQVERSLWQVLGAYMIGFAFTGVRAVQHGSRSDRRYFLGLAVALNTIVGIRELIWPATEKRSLPTLAANFGFAAVAAGALALTWSN